MTDATHEKTPLEKSRDMITQLKDMSHYSRTNIEKLTGFWLVLEGEVKQKKLAKKFETLLTHQNAIHDSLDTVITEFETESAKLDKAS